MSHLLENPALKYWMVTGVVLLTILSLAPYRYFLSDDGYIYLRYIQNLSEIGVFSYNVPTPSYGVTGPLWVMLAAAINLVVDDPYVSVKVLAIPLSLLAAVLYFHLAAHFVKERYFAFIAALALVFDPWFAKWSLSGLENPLTLSILFASLLIYYRARGTRQVAYTAYILAGLGILVRPEMVLFAGVMGLDTLLFSRERRWVKVIWASVLMGTPVILWSAYAFMEFGSFIPNTILSKSIEAEHLSTYLGTFIRSATLIGGSCLLPCLAILVLGGHALARGDLFPNLKSVLEEHFVLIAWCAFLVAFYVAGKATVSGRYILAMTPIVTLLGIIAFEAVLARAAPVHLRFGIAVCFAIVISSQLLFLQYRYTYFVTEWKQGMDPNLIELAEWIRENTPPSATVMSHEIGVLGYYSQRKIYDTGGLVSPEFIPYMHSIEEKYKFLRSLKPDYAVTMGPFDGFEDAPAELIRAIDVQREGSSTIGQPQSYHLARLHYPDER